MDTEKIITITLRDKASAWENRRTNSLMSKDYQDGQRAALDSCAGELREVIMALRGDR